MTSPLLKAPHLDTGEKLLAEVLRSRWATADVHEIQSLAGICTADAWANAIEYHGMAGVLLRFHRTMMEKYLPPPFFRAVAETHRQNAMRALQAVQALHTISRALEIARVCWITFKGPALSQMLYGDIATRGTGDLDILVDPADLEHASAALTQGGLRPNLDVPRPPDPRWQQFLDSSHQMPFASPERFLVELHWRTESSPALCLPPLSELSYALAECSLGAVTVKTLAPSVHLPYVAVHAARSICLRWKWGYDLLQFLEMHGQTGQCPLDQYARRAKPAIAMTLGMMRRLLRLDEARPPLPVARGVWLSNAMYFRRRELERRKLRDTGTRESWAAEVGYRVSRYLHLLALHDTWSSRLRFLRGVWLSFSPIDDADTALRVSRTPWAAPFVRAYRRLRLPRQRAG